MKDIPETRRAN